MRRTIIEVSKVSKYKSIYSKGKSYPEIAISIREDNNNEYLVYNGLYTVQEDESGQYVDFSITRFKDSLGKVYVKDIKLGDIPWN